MREPCPYCGDPTGALKNHVRLTSGGGHGPAGQYPDDFDGSTSPTDSAPDDSVQDATTEPADGQDDASPSEVDGESVEPRATAPTDPDGGSETVDMTPEEFEEFRRDLADGARETGYENGWHDGLEQGRREGREAALQERDTDAESATSSQEHPDPTCDECGGRLLTPGDTFTLRGTPMQVDPGEYACPPCNLVYDESEVVGQAA